MLSKAQVGYALLLSPFHVGTQPPKAAAVPAFLALGQGGQGPTGVGCVLSMSAKAPAAGTPRAARVAVWRGAGCAYARVVRNYYKESKARGVCVACSCSSVFLLDVMSLSLSGVAQGHDSVFLAHIWHTHGSV